MIKFIALAFFSGLLFGSEFSEKFNEEALNISAKLPTKIKDNLTMSSYYIIGRTLYIEYKVKDYTADMFNSVCKSENISEIINHDYNVSIMFLDNNNYAFKHAILNKDFCEVK